MINSNPALYSTLCSLVAVLGIASLGGCDKLTPNGTSNTISLLKAGSERVCVASDVQKDLKKLILPEPAELGSDMAQDDAQSAIGQLSLSFDATTLQSTDSSVSKATCTTYASVSSNGETRRFRVSYDISPSAEDPSQVVVSADTSDVAAYAKSEVDNTVARINEAHAQQQQAAQDEQAHQQLLAIVTPKWLVGSWIGASQDASACGNGQALTFRANHGIDGVFTGRWVLTADHLHAVGQGPNGTTNIDADITAADPLSFTLTQSEGTTSTMRRCSAEEIESYSAKAPDTFGADTPAQN